ncbi:hypothetical protein MLD38_003269 [Melastoma candidum]|uniref:Uncharacterized protein n=1 Tax=Melastoma candidum TaxID=119954 RepID=A0ACB9S1I3_9MYRT|nr:hypothetical protein MLD38_003269 [Melastoma candidum]
MIPKWRRVIVFVMTSSFFFCNVRALFDGRLKKVVCNGELYPQHPSILDPDNVYECAVNHIVKLMPRYTPSIRDHQFYYAMRCEYPNSVSRVYGRSSCKEALSPDDCTSCLQHALDNLFIACSHNIGAQIQLEDCRVR